MTALSLWYEGKMFIEHSVAFSPDVLHIFAGMIVTTVTALVLRRPLSSAVPLVITLVAAVLNETGDLVIERWPSLGMQSGEGVRDILLTAAVPAITYLGLKLCPGLFEHASSSRRTKVARADESGL